MTGSRSFDGYDRDALRPTVVHVGPGVFHRAHQAVYGDTVLRTGSPTGAIQGISLRTAAVRDALAPVGFVYHVVERDPSGGDARDVVRPVGALLGVDVAARDVQAALARLVDPAVTVVTITVTEHGYCAVGPGGPLDLSRPEIIHDLEAPAAPRSLPGLLVEALVRRRAAGTAPFTVVSCDNLPANGPSTARVVRELAEHRTPSVASWIDDHVAFPSSMVDRMVPTTTPDLSDRLRRQGIVDPWPVAAEPFSQWVLEDVFPEGRPPWERAGVELVSDVSPHEQAKLRILNAAHSALAYWGLLAGHPLVSEAVADRALAAATSDLLASEVLPTLSAPPGWDLAAYADQVLTRFGNRALGYTTSKVAADGSQKLPARLVPTIRSLLATGRPAPRCALVLAAWVVCVAGPRSTALAVEDAALPIRRRASPSDGAADLEHVTAALMDLPGFLDAQYPAEHALREQVLGQVRRLWRASADDVRTCLAGVRPPTTTTSPGAPR